MHLSLSLTFIFIKQNICWIYIMHNFSIVTLLISIVSLVVFHPVCHTSSFKINPSFFWQELQAVGAMLCLLVTDIFSLALVLRCIALLHMVVLYYIYDSIKHWCIFQLTGFHLAFTKQFFLLRGDTVMTSLSSFCSRVAISSVFLWMPMCRQRL